MRKVILDVTVAACLVVLSAVAVHAQKKRVAVMNLEYGASQKSYSYYNDTIGVGVADRIVDELVKDGTYAVVERRELDEILREQGLSREKNFNASTAVLCGKMLGASVVLVGSITEFGYDKKDFNLSGLLRHVPHVGGGDFGESTITARAAFSARLIDVATGEVLATATGSGNSKQSFKSVTGGGYGVREGADLSSPEFLSTALGKATERAVADLVAKLVGARDRIPDVRVEVRGKVAEVNGRAVILNVGTSKGVRAGARFGVYRVTGVVMDPDNPQKVLREKSLRVGELVVESVEATSSDAKIVSGDDVRVGDVVRREDDAEVKVRAEPRARSKKKDDDDE
jgi:curli biogenesis system outer membrane secretion channel CsgG